MFTLYTYGPQAGWLGFITFDDGTVVFVPDGDGEVYVHKPVLA